VAVAVVFFVTAFFAPGRRDDTAAGLAVLPAAVFGRDGGTVAGAGVGAGVGSGVGSVNASGTAGAGEAAGASAVGAGNRWARPSRSRA
jgi:hypothetical protein